MSLLIRIMGFLFRKKHGGQGWESREHNQRLCAAIGDDRAMDIKAADERNRKRYDDMDSHIASLRRLIRQSRARKYMLKTHEST